MNAIPFDQFCTEYIGVLSGPRYAVATRKKMEQVPKQVDALGVRSTAELTTKTVSRYAQGRSERVCPNTVRGELTYLRAACNYAIEEEYLDRGPRFRRSLPRKSPRIRKVLHPIESIRLVLDHLEQGQETWFGHRLFVVGSFAALTGARKSEVLYARWSDLDLGRGIWNVSARYRLKTEGSERPVPLCGELITIARGWRWRSRSEHLVPNHLLDEPWTTGGKGFRPTDQLVAAGLEVGVEGFTCASLRHSWSTWARRRWGLTGVEVRDILGHTTIQTHERNYLHGELDDADLVRIAGKIGYR
jgi:integrase